MKVLWGYWQLSSWFSPSVAQPQGKAQVAIFNLIPEDGRGYVSRRFFVETRTMFGSKCSNAMRGSFFGYDLGVSGGVTSMDDFLIEVLSAFAEMGFLPEAMVNYLALLGWDDVEFTIERVNKSGAIFDSAKLRFEETFGVADYCNYEDMNYAI
ncbi:Glutamate--tRNA ligase, chloroplastic mitochondrial [Olea europaea subsp. europaea]|uniref:Glutamate--tRNA ligase, chloroplastic mitochondrial n=1 Tax=Olea europaea subsp. europaea TaxID=158383 RepID=A0A8S0V4X1_OLEEU|nr:Glutamate--tRNA ligase, chloroplastic mitochondrial [Olea europaea subsp. europaea]